MNDDLYESTYWVKCQCCVFNGNMVFDSNHKVFNEINNTDLHPYDQHLLHLLPVAQYYPESILPM